LALPRSELLKIRNFGQKSINELFEVLSNEGLLPSDTSDAAKVSEESGEQDSS
jgi:DNA-directed RNA polymerase alpha subunit